MTFEETLKTIVRDAMIEVMEGRSKVTPTADYIPPSKPVLSIAEAAQHLGVAVSAVTALTHRADCDFCLVEGRRRRILSHRLMAYMERMADERQGTTL